MKHDLCGDPLRRVRIYDATQRHKQYEQEAAHVISLAGGVPRNCLDIGCGTGTHAIAFAQMGIVVTALDIDEDAIRLARIKASASVPSNPPRFLKRELDHDVEGPFGLVTSLFNVVNYLLDESVASALINCVASLMEPGATFVFDAWAPRRPDQYDSVAVSREVELDGFPLRLRTQINFLPDDLVEMRRDVFSIEEGGVDGEEISSELVRHRLWSPDQLTRFVVDAGLRIESVGGWSNLNTSDAKRTPRVFACRKEP